MSDAVNEPGGRLPVGGDLWSIHEVVKTSGVSSRTLRHYDEIGLLTPAEVGRSGVRSYDRGSLLRLQQILLLRELDLSLAQIQQIIDGQLDPIHALREQQERLSAGVQRLQRIGHTIDATIADLERERTMTAGELFDGFDPKKQSQYEAELVERVGAEAQSHIDESWARIAQMSKNDAVAINQGYGDVEVALTLLLQADGNVDDPEVQALIAVHYAIVCKFWTPTAEAYAGLGEMYVSHPDFRARYDALDEGLAEFLRDAMTVFAVEHLT